MLELDQDGGQGGVGLSGRSDLATSGHGVRKGEVQGPGGTEMEVGAFCPGPGLPP